MGLVRHERRLPSPARGALEEVERGVPSVDAPRTRTDEALVPRLRGPSMRTREDRLVWVAGGQRLERLPHALAELLVSLEVAPQVRAHDPVEWYISLVRRDAHLAG